MKGSEYSNGGQSGVRIVQEILDSSFNSSLHLFSLEKSKCRQEWYDDGAILLETLNQIKYNRAQGLHSW